MQWEHSFIDLLLIFAVIIAVVSLLLGGRNSTAIKKMWRIITLIVVASSVTFFLFVFIGSNSDIAYRFVENVVPFGSVIGVIIRILTKLPDTNTNFLWSIWGTASYLIENTFKLLLSTVIYPIVTKGFFMPFFVDNDYENHMFPMPIRRVVVSLFGAVITSFAVMLIVSELGKFLETYGQIGAVVNSVYKILGLAGIVWIVILTPIITYKINLLGSLFKMLIINFACVFIVIMVQYQEHFGNILMVILVCVAISITIDVFFKQKEPDWPIKN